MSESSFFISCHISFTGISVATLTDAAIECQRKTDPEARTKTLTYMINHMTRFLRELYRLQMMASPFARLWYIFYGNYLAVMYIFVKLIYIGNVIGQLFLLNEFLGSKYHYYGYEVLLNLINGRSWTTSDRFPRITLCDFKIRVLGHVNRYTVQCALPINLFNEKIFTFLWFWFLFVAIATLISMIIWAVRLAYLPGLVKYVKTKLVAMDKLDHASDKVVKKFTEHYLKRDGLLVIWLVGKNSSDLIAAEFVCGLFKNYRANQKGLDRLCSRDGNMINNVAFTPDKGIYMSEQSIRRRLPAEIQNEILHDIHSEETLPMRTNSIHNEDTLPIRNHSFENGDSIISDDKESYSTAVT